MNKYSTKIFAGIFFMFLHAGVKAQTDEGRTDYHVHLQDSETVQLGYRMLKAIGQAPTKMDSLVLDADTIIERLDRAHLMPYARNTTVVIAHLAGWGGVR